MSKEEQEEKNEKKEIESRKRYENLNNNELKFKKKSPSSIYMKEKERNSYLEYSSESSKNKKHNQYSFHNYRRSRSRSSSYSKERNGSKYHHSYYEDRRYDDYHHRHHKHRRHHRDYSGKKNNNKIRNREEKEESMRREILKNNNINAFLQGKSSNIFYDDNYLPISSNPYKYLGKPGYEDTLEKIDEIPISNSDITKKDFELYVINLPQDLTEEQIKELLNTALISIEANERKGEPITKVTKPKNGKYFILEFRTRTECKNAMKLNGMKILNRTLKIGQPNYLNEKEGNNYQNNNINSSSKDLFPILSSFEKEFDYKKGLGVDANSFIDYQNKALNLISGQNLLYNIPMMFNSSNNISEQKRNSENLSENNKPEPGTKLHIVNIPESFNENDINKLFKTFGKIKKIELLKDESNKFNGQCYLEYEKEKSYQDAINYGTGLKLGDNFLLINRVNPKDDNKIDSTIINYLDKVNFNLNSSLGILGSSINLRTYNHNNINN